LSGFSLDGSLFIKINANAKAHSIKSIADYLGSPPNPTRLNWRLFWHNLSRFRSDVNGGCYCLGWGVFGFLPEQFKGISGILLIVYNIVANGLKLMCLNEDLLTSLNQ